MKLNGITAVIFDFDGVILESANIKTEAFVELFADYPEHQPAVLQHHLENLGVSRYDKFAWIYRELLKQPCPEEESRRLGQAFSDLVLDKILACDSVPGALETLAALHGRYPLFVASGTPQEELDLIIRQRELGHYFAEVWGSPRKKADIINDIRSRHGWQQEALLMVGDGVSDYKAAQATGIRFVARNTPELAEQWRAYGVPLVEDLRQMADVL